jgi:hypothetical protein
MWPRDYATKKETGRDVCPVFQLSSTRVECGKDLGADLAVAPFARGRNAQAELAGRCDALLSLATLALPRTPELFDLPE